jgi:hypothetical protein
MRGHRKLANGYLVQHIKVAVVDRLLNQTADKELGLLATHGMPHFCLSGNCPALASAHGRCRPQVQADGGPFQATAERGQAVAGAKRRQRRGGPLSRRPEQVNMAARLGWESWLATRAESAIRRQEPPCSVRFYKQSAGRVSTDAAYDRPSDRTRPGLRRETAQPPTGTFSTEASKICPIEASSWAWNCSSVCWADRSWSSAREKLAIMPGSLASNAHASSRL